MDGIGPGSDRGEQLEVGVEHRLVPGRPQRDVDLVGTGADVLEDALDRAVAVPARAPGARNGAAGPKPWRSTTSTASVPSLVRAKMRFTLRRKVAGSRPSDSHHRSATALSSAYRSGGMYAAFHPSAWRAAIRNVRFSPVPPIQIGRRACTGAGRQDASTVRKCSPLWVVRSSVSRLRISGSASSSWSRRRPTGGKSYPNASASGSCHPAPRPSSNRPPEMWSSVVAALASRPGFR